MTPSELVALSTPDAEMELQLQVEPDGEPGYPLTVRRPYLVVAGFTGRDERMVQRHISELELLGVPRPSSTPTAYLLPNWLLRTASPAVQVRGERTSGEAEPVLVIMPGGATYVTVGSDVTDRVLETESIDVAKLVCPKMVAQSAWPFDAVAAHWDRLLLRAQLDEGSLYQEETLAAILPPQRIVAAVAALELDPDRPLVLFLGTVPLLDGGFRFGAAFAATLEDPVRGTELRCRYGVEALTSPRPDKPYGSRPQTSGPTATTGKGSS
jgi:4-hydroxyphenylacetate 3-monooxygenase